MLPADRDDRRALRTVTQVCPTLMLPFPPVVIRSLSPGSIVI